jgi:hypothetical protein
MHPHLSAGNTSIAITSLMLILLLHQMLSTSTKQQITEQKKLDAIVREIEAPETPPRDASEGVAILLPLPPILEQPEIALKVDPAIEPVETRTLPPVVPIEVKQPRLVEKEEKVIEPVKPQESVVKTHTNTGDLIKKEPITEQPESTSHTIELNATTSREATRQGSVLLRLLEHGDGPSIEITWPKSEPLRHRLFTQLSRCFGMQTAMIDDQGNLYIAEGRSGERWDLNLDRYSGFVRTPTGYLTDEERMEAAKIQRHHMGIRGLATVRIFPRKADALLLGGLNYLLGNRYKSAKRISAQYRFRNRELIIDGIHADSQSVPGEILFPVTGRCL